MKIKTNILPSPALIETYCRLLSSPEVASPAIKSLLGTLLPSILKSNAWIYLHMILEMFSYRLTHISVFFIFKSVMPTYLFKSNLILNLESAPRIISYSAPRWTLDRTSHHYNQASAAQREHGVHYP